MGPYKLKRFCTAKNTINNTEKKPSEQGKIFANKVTDKGLLSETHKQFMKFNMKKNPNQTMGRRLKQTLSNEDIQVAKKHIKDAQNF